MRVLPRAASATLLASLAGIALVVGPVRPAAGAAGDPRLSQQWGLAVVGAPAAWARTRGAGVTIAVLDSGVDGGQEDLRGAIRASVSCVGAAGDAGRCAADTGDDDGHGTHVAGVAAARHGNGVGGAGVAPEAALLSVKVLSRQCQPQVASGEACRALGSSADVSAGIRWATDHGADVINVSIASDAASTVSPTLPIGDAVRYAWSQGAVVVAAAGNNFGTVAGPGYDHLPVVVVTATGPGDTHPAYSNPTGDAQWTVSAPGGSGPTGACPADNILSTYPGASGSEYRCMYGTSMAAPHVSGALALLRAEGYTAQGAVDRLLATAHDVGVQGPDSAFGAGRIDVAAATSAPPPAASPPRAQAAASPPAQRVATAAAATPSVAQPRPAPAAAAPAPAPSPAPSSSPATSPAIATSDQRTGWAAFAGQAHEAIGRARLNLVLAAAAVLALLVALAMTAAHVRRARVRAPVRSRDPLSWP